MNLATKLTLMRVVAIPFFIVAFSWKNPGSELSGDWGKVIATIIFVIAAITDYYDGYLARRY
ncbi:MAG: CDP-alcohol phosphatidyltransferase family protein, partial [Candidatus Rifleibacteriota bacterium]